MTVKDAGGSNHAPQILFALLAVIPGWLLGGCESSPQYVPRSSLPYRELSELYYQIPLQQSGSLDIQRRMKEVEGTVDAKYVEREVITQGDAAIASSGRSLQGVKSWFTLVAFDKYSNTAHRKYFFFLDEKAGVTPLGSKRYLVPARAVLVFDCEAMVGEVLAAPHASEQDRKIATVNYLARHLQEDVEQLAVKSPQMRNADIVGVSGMFMNQVLRDALNELRKYPVLTRELDSPTGVTFESMSLTNGRLRLVVENNRATARIEMGFSN